MLLLTNLLASSLDYNATERQKINNSNFLNPTIIEEVIYNDRREDYLKHSNTFLFNFKGISSVYQTISSQLKEEFEKNNISSDVYKTSFDLISLLPESILVKLEEDNIYPTNYGTIVLDWEDIKSSDEFSLEIGKNCFGYFSELNGKDTVNIEEVSFNSEEVNTLYKKIEEFYQR